MGIITEQIMNDIKNGTITEAVDFWCYRKAIELTSVPKSDWLHRTESLHPEIKNRVRKHLLKYLNK